MKTLDERGGKFNVNPPKSKTGIRTVNLLDFALVAIRLHLDGRKLSPVFVTQTGKSLSKTNFIRKEKSGSHFWKRLRCGTGSSTRYVTRTHRDYWLMELVQRKWQNDLVTASKQ